MTLKITRPSKPKNFNTPFTTDYLHQFSQFLAEHGLEPDPKKGLIADGSIGRAYINVGGQRKLVGWYQLWTDQSVPFGRLGDYRVSADQPTAIWKPENSQRRRITKKQKEEIAQLQKQQRSNRPRSIHALPNALRASGTKPYHVRNTLT